MDELEQSSTQAKKPFWVRDNPFATDLGKPYRKMLFYGHILEVYEMQGTPIIHKGHRGRTKEKSVEIEENWKKTRRRARWKVMRLINANFYEGSTFVTLTFSDAPEITTKEGKVYEFKHWKNVDFRNVAETNKCFDRFIKRLKKKVGDLKYLAVIEFQDANGRGAVHYHMICNLPYVNQKEFMEKVWGHGWVGLNKIKHVDNVGVYVSAYMTADVSDLRLQGKKAYLSSHNLSQPEVITAEEADELYEVYGLGAKKEVLTNVYDSEYLGQITYKQYNLKR